MRDRSKLGPSTKRRVRLAVWTVACCLVFFPDLLGLDRWTPFAQLVAFRPLLVGLGLVAGLAALTWRNLRVAALVTVLTALVGALQVIPRLTGVAQPGSADDPLSVLTANVQASSADVGTLAETIRRHEPEVVVLPEANSDYREELERAVRPLGYHGRSAGAGGFSVAATSVLVSRDLGPVRFDTLPKPTFAGLTLTGGELGRTRVVAFHAFPPLPLTVSRWRDDLALLSRWCGESSQGPVVVAGDFNASLDHSVFRASTGGCTPAAASLGGGLRGTWPSSLPAWLGSRIDHVLVRGMTTQDTAIFDIPGTDHRAVLAHLTIGAQS